MSKKNRSLIELQTNIDEDFINRRKELILIKDLVERNSKNSSGLVFSKTLLVFLYAHWEGFIKHASESLLQYISLQNLKNKDLNLGLLAISNLTKIDEFLESKVTLKIKALEYIFDKMEKRAEIPRDYMIATYSKLNTETLEEICMIIGINESFYSLKKGIIDEKLVKNRNSISHGNWEKFEAQEILDIYGQVFPIMEKFKSDVLNRAVFINLKSIN